MTSPSLLAPADKVATTDFPILPVLAARWSPYGFADQPVPPADLCSLFEAARWAASSYNEQPWNYLVATREEPDQFARMLSCLAEANQAWARSAPVLVLGIVRHNFTLNHQGNRAAVYDLGLASGNLVTEATSRGLSVHQMIGLLSDRARELYTLPAHVEAWTAMAIGYRAEPGRVPDAWKERDQMPRTRKPTREFVFSGEWGRPSHLTGYQP